jgi:hypothetical protein
MKQKYFVSGTVTFYGHFDRLNDRKPVAEPVETLFPKVSVPLQ